MTHLSKSLSTGGPAVSDRRSRPRLLTVIPHLGAGGAERAVANLLAAMRPNLFEYHLVTLAPPQPGDRDLPDYVRRWSLGVKRVETSGLALTRLIRRLNPDLVYSHIVAMNVMTVLAVRASRTGARVIVVDHHMASADVSDTGRAGPFHALLAPAMRWAYPRADRVVGVSQTVLDDTLKIAPGAEAKGVVIPNPVVYDELEVDSQPPAQHAWLDSADYEVVLGVGRLLPAKNYELLIDAFGLVAARRPNARLVIVGEGALRSSLQERIDQLGLSSRAALVGFWRNPFRAMRRARVVAVTSHTEGLSTVLIESMALGTPVVATDFASARETLPEGLVEPVQQTPEAVAADILTKLDDAGDIEGLKAFAADFTVRPIAQRYEDLFLDVLDDGAHGRSRRSL